MGDSRTLRPPLPYLLTADRYLDETLAFLPAADVVFAFRGGDHGRDVQALMPHTSVVVLPGVVAVWSLSPNFAKALLGPPAQLRQAVLRSATHRSVRLFAAEPNDRAALALLQDLRSSLTVTADEVEFERTWRAHRFGRVPLPTSDRRVQRMMQRFAGQSPSQIAAVERLGSTLRADLERGGYNSLGLYADDSHYARVCRALTGHTPGQWRNVSRVFYGGHGAKATVKVNGTERVV